ncbi:MAG: 30S ribosomal protein S3 [Candidatus Aenigmarchaeota archaeon]|nr:30S ribosomal protein S3 [Candidatus Aenigmarchaeota archaeon]
MAQERKFIVDSIRRVEVEDYFAKEFSRAGYSHVEIQRTPLAMRIIVFANKPGMIIGRGGKKIDAMIEKLKNEFGFKNPEIDVQEVENPNLDPFIVARDISNALERGLNYKRVCNNMVQKVMNAGAVGVAIKLSGKLGGARGRTEKFSAGYLKYAGFPAENIVKKAFTLAQLKLGTVGITVRILTEMPAEKQIKQIKVDDNKNEIKHEILEEGKEDVTDKEERVKENGESRTDEETK